MGSDLVQRHLLALLDRILDAGRRAEKEGLPDSSLVLAFLPDCNDVSVAADELRKLGLRSAADSLEEQAQALQNASLDLGLADMVAAGEDYERLRERYGEFPKPHSDSVRQKEIQAERRLGISGRLFKLVEFVDVLRKSLVSEDPLQDGPMPPTSFRIAGKNVDLKKTGFKLLEFVWSKPGNTALVRDVCVKVWGDEEKASTTLNSTITRVNNSFLVAELSAKLSRKGEFVVLEIPEKSVPFPHD